MRDFITKRKRVLLLLMTLVLAFLMISIDISSSRETRELNFIDRLIFWTISPFQQGISAIRTTAEFIWYNYIYLINLKVKNELMNDKLGRLEIEVVRLREKAFTADRLVKFLEFKDDAPHEQKAARIIGHDSSGYFRTVILDKGKKDGVELNMPVVTAEGVVGRVIKLHPFYCQVLLIIDYNSAVDALIQRTRERGIVVGLGDIQCQIKYVNHQADVQVGDLVVTSGLAGIYPKGLMLGRVVEVERKGYGLFLKLSMIPSANMSKLEEVLILGKSEG